MAMGGDAQVGQGIFVHDQQHGNVAAVVQPFGNLFDAIVTNAIGIEHEQVKVVRSSWRIGSRSKNLRPHGLREGTREFVVSRGASHEKDVFL